MPPQRTCLVCRRHASAGELLRLTAQGDGRLTVGPAPLAAGRGAWICPSHQCVARIERQPQRLARALGRGVHGSPGAVLRVAMNHAAAALLPAAQRAGCIAGGQVKVAAGLESSQFEAVIVALDASARVASRALAALGETPIVQLELTSLELGRLLGKGPRAVLGVRRGAPARALLSVLRQCASLGYHPGQHRTGARPEATRRHGITRSRGQGPRNPLPPEVVPEGSPTSAEETRRREGSVCPRKRS